MCEKTLLIEELFTTKNEDEKWEHVQWQLFFETNSRFYAWNKSYLDLFATVATVRGPLYCSWDAETTCEFKSWEH